jgi:hypothetical protein
MSEVQHAAATAAPAKRSDGSRGRSTNIKAVHIPSQGGDPLSVVTLDRRNVTRWYRYVNGGPVEPVSIQFNDISDHAVYVNSRYASMDPDRVNDRATALLRFCGVGMYLNEIRGDVLVVGSVGDSGYPTSIDEDLVYVLCDDD